MKEKIYNTLLGIVIGLLLISVLGYSFVPSFRKAIKEHVFKIQQVDEETSYKNRKSVEYSARA